MKNKIKHIEDVAAWQLCCGCGVCASVCPDQIEMVDVLDSGRRPRFKENTDPLQFQLALDVCPGIALSRPPLPIGQIGGKDFYDGWGPVLEICEGHATDEQIRFEGSSGGAATALSLFALERLGMAGILHIRSREDRRYLNQSTYSRTRTQLMAGTGSRYAPASPCDALQLIEKTENPSVFIGKPCDVAAVHKAAQLNPRLQEKLGLAIAFFCAGTPSTRGTIEMLRQMGVEPESIVSLRYRGRGWPGKATVEYKDKDGQVRQKQLTYDQSWGDILQKYRQWRCYICPDHIGEFADITVADAWHQPVDKYQPGRSIMIARTIRGQEFLRKAQQAEVVTLFTSDHKVLEKCMPWNLKLKGQLWARIQTLRFWGVPVPFYSGYRLSHLWMSELSIKQKVLSFLSTGKRILLKKLYKAQNNFY